MCLFHRLLRRVCDILALFAFFEAVALSADFFLQVMQALGIVFVKSKGTVPESTVNICRLVSPYDLSLGCEVYGRYAVFFAGNGANRVNLAATGHVVE